MTVSPNRLSDGSRSSDYARIRDSIRERAASGSLSDTLTMPPVLFSLRNLKPVSHPKSVLPSSVATTEVRTDHVDHPVVHNDQSTSRLQEPRQPDSQRVAPADRQITPQDAPVERFVAPMETTPERPIGRTWMETAVANRNVLLMLAIVIAIAFWTSRKGSAPAEPDTALAETGDILNIDAGDLVAGAPSFVDEIAKTEPASMAISRPSNSNGTNGSADVPVSVSLQSPQTVSPPSQSVVAPSFSQSDASKTSAASNSFDGFGTQASSVSSRKPNDDFSDLLTNSSIDGIDEAASDDASWETTPNVETQGPTLSQTPASVGDWLRFLPPAPNQ